MNLIPRLTEAEKFSFVCCLIFWCVFPQKQKEQQESKPLVIVISLLTMTAIFILLKLFDIYLKEQSTPPQTESADDE